MSASTTTAQHRPLLVSRPGDRTPSPCHRASGGDDATPMVRPPSRGGPRRSVPPPPRPPETAYRELRELQGGIRHADAATVRRRRALRRAQQRCEDLSELLGRLDGDPRCEATTQARRAARTAARDLWRLVAGRVPAPAPGASLSVAALDALVEEIDAAVCDVAAGWKAAEALVVHLAAQLVTAIEAVSR